MTMTIFDPDLSSTGYVVVSCESRIKQVIISLHHWPVNSETSHWLTRSVVTLADCMRGNRASNA